MATVLQSLTSKTEEAMKCRIFIGNLPNEAVTKDLLKNMFIPFGTYVDCSIYKNYGFVQFNDEESAKKAVESLVGVVLFDRRLDIKIASAGKKDKNGVQTNQAGVGKTKRTVRPNLNAIQPLMSRPAYDPNFNYMARPMPPNPYPYGAPPMNPPPYGYPTASMQPPPNSFPPMHPNHVKPLMQMTPTQPIGVPQPNLSVPNAQNRTPLQTMNDSSGNSKLCEIICTTRKQLSYAEYIESVLSRIGFSCNINLLGANYSPEIILNRITHDSYSIAISFKDENEANRSCNLHILFGAAEEHRNMPLHVAEQLLRKRFGFSNGPTNSSQPPSSNNSTAIPNVSSKDQTPPVLNMKRPTFTSEPSSISSSVAVVPLIDTKLTNKTTNAENLVTAANYTNAPLYTNTPYYGGYRAPMPQDPSYYPASNIYQNQNMQTIPMLGSYPPMPPYAMNNTSGKRI